MLLADYPESNFTSACRYLEGDRAMGNIRFKPSVVLKPAPGGARILAALDHVAFACKRDVLVSCGAEGHPEDDPHTRGDAYDVSIKGLSCSEVDITVNMLEQFLGAEKGCFTVLLEAPTQMAGFATPVYVNRHASAPHLHIQVKKGLSYPPSPAAPDVPAAGTPAEVQKA